VVVLEVQAVEVQRLTQLVVLEMIHPLILEAVPVEAIVVVVQVVQVARVALE
jgi:hypothetical protein